jgi:hypothetical protein
LSRLHHLNHASGLTFPVPPEKLRETGTRTGLHSRMDKKLNAVVCPHPPLPLPYVRNKDQLEVGPIRIETIIDARVRLDPIAIDIPPDQASPYRSCRRCRSP